MKTRTKKIIWTIVLILSTVVFAALLLPAMNVYLGWHVPFFKGGYGTWTYLWWTVSAEKQWGLMMATAVFAMLPGRLVCLAIAKIVQPSSHDDHDMWGEHGNYNSMYFYDNKGNRMIE